MVLLKTLITREGLGWISGKNSSLEEWLNFGTGFGTGFRKAREPPSLEVFKN